MSSEKTEEYGDERAFSRIIAVGDIHGWVGPLRRMLEKLEPANGDLLIFIGDYIDRGPESKEVIETLLGFSALFKDVVFLKGNHEDMLLGSVGFHAVVKDLSTWLYNGGGNTLKSYGMSNDDVLSLTQMWDEEARLKTLKEFIPISHLNFLVETRLWFETQNYFFCHAGVNPEFSIEEGKQHEFDLLWMREHLYADNERWEKTLVCGHTPLQEVLMRKRLICIDTGLYYYGVLSAVDVLKKKIYQVSQ